MDLLISNKCKWTMKENKGVQIYEIFKMSNFILIEQYQL